MSRFQPGDPALVKNAHLEENIGKEVVVLLTTTETFITFPDGRKHYNRERSNVCLVEGNLLTKCISFLGIPFDGNVQNVRYGIFPESWLMPLKGQVDDIEVEEDEHARIPSRRQRSNHQSVS